MYLEFDCLGCGFEFINVTTLEKEKAELHMKCGNCGTLFKIVVNVEEIKED